jgi:hypothetical protein
MYRFRLKVQRVELYIVLWFDQRRAMFVYSTGLWRRGTCQGSWGGGACCNSGDTKWVLPCWDCQRTYCEKNTVDACRFCALPICAECCRVHRKAAGESPCAGRPNIGQLEVQKTICSQCGGILDFGISHCCEGCQASQCLNDDCPSQLRTSHCCGRDVCGKCAELLPARVSYRQFEWHCFTC